MKILVVDRDAELAALIAFALGQASYQICFAADAATALQKLELESPDLALLEHHAPEFDGAELCRQLRARSRLPIIVLSPQASEEDLVAQHAANAQAADLSPATEDRSGSGGSELDRDDAGCGVPADHSVSRPMTTTRPTAIHMAMIKERSAPVDVARYRVVVDVARGELALHDLLR